MGVFTNEREQALLNMSVLLTIAALSGPGDIFDDSNVYLSVPLDVSLTEDRLPRHRKVMKFNEQRGKIEKADPRINATGPLH